MYWFGVDDGTTVVDGKAGCGGGAVGEEDDGDAEPGRVREQRRPPPERIRRESIQEDEEQGQRILGVIAAELDRVCCVGGGQAAGAGDALRFDGSSQLTFGSCPSDGGVGCDAGEDPLSEVG